MKREFKPIDTSVPGLKISEVFPKLAKVMDRVTLIRERLLARGRPRPGGASPPDRLPAEPGPGLPQLRERGLEGPGGEPGGDAPYVAMPDAPIFASSGYLTPAFDPFAAGGDPNAEGFRVRDLTPPDRVTLERLNRRRGMVKTIDGFTRDVATTTLVSSRDQFADRRMTCSPRPRPRRRSGSATRLPRSGRPTGGTRSASRASWPGGWSRRASRS